MTYSWTDLLAGLTGFGIIVLCVWGWRNSDKQAARFRNLGSLMYGDRVANKVYTSASLRIGAVGGLVVGVLMVVLGATGKFV